MARFLPCDPRQAKGDTRIPDLKKLLQLSTSTLSSLPLVKIEILLKFGLWTTPIDLVAIDGTLRRLKVVYPGVEV